MNSVDISVVKHGKGSRASSKRISKPQKRRYHPPRNKVASSTSAERPSSRSEQKLRDSLQAEIKTRQDCSHVMLDFNPVFEAVAALVVCRDCGNTMSFSREDERGLGFKLVVRCAVCEVKGRISNCKMIGEVSSVYELNVRSVLGMRLLGQGQAELETFLGVMDLHQPLTRNPNLDTTKKLLDASKIVVETSMTQAVREELELTKESSNILEDNCIAGSGDGSFRKRGHNSHHGFASMIGNKTGKVLDKELRASYCQECTQMEKKANTHPDEYEQWLNAHSFVCKAYHDGSSGKMEVDAITEMFRRSRQKLGVFYKFFIGDGDAANFKAICVDDPYNGEVEVKKKECVGHVQKRMGTRLRKLKKSYGSRKLSDNRTIGGTGRLTNDLILKLQQYYGNAIRQNVNSLDGMRASIWATFYHMGSTDEEPQHQYCPKGSCKEETWCDWQIAAATNQDFHHDEKKTIPQAVLEVIKPIYEALTDEKLLEACLGGYTQNSNESLHSKLWKLAPKSLFSGTDTVELAANIAVSTFNDGMIAVIRIMEEMKILPGPACESWIRSSDAQRIKDANKRVLEESKESRKKRRLEREAMDEEAAAAEGALYSAGAH